MSADPSSNSTNSTSKILPELFVSSRYTPQSKPPREALIKKLRDRGVPVWEGFASNEGTEENDILTLVAKKIDDAPFSIVLGTADYAEDTKFVANTLAEINTLNTLRQKGKFYFYIKMCAIFDHTTAIILFPEGRVFDDEWLPDSNGNFIMKNNEIDVPERIVDKIVHKYLRHVTTATIQSQLPACGDSRLLSDELLKRSAELSVMRHLKETLQWRSTKLLFLTELLAKFMEIVYKAHDLEEHPTRHNSSSIDDMLSTLNLNIETVFTELESGHELSAAPFQPIKATNLVVIESTASSQTNTARTDIDSVDEAADVDVDVTFIPSNENSITGNLTIKKGIHVLPTGAIWTGAMDNGHMQGKAVVRYSNGDVYVGEYVDGRRHGTGIYSCANGSCYEGGYKRDRRDGQGLLITNDLQYNGGWKDGVKHGLGILTYKSGKVVKGEWILGKMPKKSN